MKKKKSHLLPLYLNRACREFVTSLLCLFSAIYIYKTLGSLTLVFFFFFLYHLSKLLVNFLAEELSLKLGLKKQACLGQFFYIFALILLFFSEKDPLLIFPASILWGIASGLYWFGWHGLMAKMSHLGKYGNALGQQEIFNLIPILVSPILGGILINFFGYWALFSACLFFLILSLFILWPIPEKKTHYDTSPVEIFSLFKTHKRMFLAYFGNSAAATIYVIAFPIYLFLILKSELSIGGFFSLSLILVAILSFLIGQFVDSQGKKELIVFGSVLSFLIWAGRLMAKEVNFLFFLDVSDKVVNKMTSIPLDVLSYEKALDGGATGRAVLFRETATQMGGVFVSLLLLFLNNFSFSFIAAAILALLPLLIVKKRGVYGDGKRYRM